jgi:hypothetical protein
MYAAPWPRVILDRRRHHVFPVKIQNSASGLAHSLNFCAEWCSSPTVYAAIPFRIDVGTTTRVAVTTPMTRNIVISVTRIRRRTRLDRHARSERLKVIFPERARGRYNR